MSKPIHRILARAWHKFLSQQKARSVERKLELGRTWTRPSARGRRRRRGGCQASWTPVRGTPSRKANAPTPETQPLCESGRAPSEALLSLTVGLLNWPRCKPVAFSPNSEVMGMKNMSRAADEPPSPALWAPSPTRRGNKKIRLTLPSPFGRGAGGEGLKPMREYISIQFRISDLAKATCHWFKAVSIL